jgi:hypothetical protein
LANRVASPDREILLEMAKEWDAIARLLRGKAR